MILFSIDLIELFGFGLEIVKWIIGEVLLGVDDGELFVEYCQMEGFVFDNGCLKGVNYDIV